MADTDQVLNLAAIIRKVDGNHSKGAAALAESILDHPGFRAVLAGEPAEPEGREPASVTGQPSDEEIMGLMPQQMHEALAAAVRAMAEQQGIDSTPAKGAMRIILNRHVVDLARAVLARWGHQPAPPADGEVAGLVEMLKGIAYWRLHGTDKPTPFDIRQAARLTRAAELLQRQAPQPPADGEVVEVVEWLREQLHVCLQAPWTPGIKYFGRAAELLERQATACAICERERLHQSTRAADLEVERQAAPVPVPVNERLPEPEDCYAEGRCWWFCFECPGEHSYWILAKEVYCNPTYWLPAHALPLPEVGE
jgi:hypothetical protein